MSVQLIAQSRRRCCTSQATATALLLLAGGCVAVEPQARSVRPAPNAAFTAMYVKQR
ncbi:hypothetical protein [Methylorubrum aminovorans]|uniref:hypothetical protein n=1 Tax=Methylorubrum aminovorans TaxID=269069 RepID=UPI003C2AEB27